MTSEPPAIDRKIADLVQPGRVHRRAYSDAGLFELETERIFARAWCYVGHESQVPETGSFIRASIARRQLVVVRQENGDIGVLHNRCGHRGALVVAERSGRVNRFRCPYHAWALRTNGHLQSVPCIECYDGTGFDTSDPALGMAPVARVGTYRGFIFASLVATGPDLDAFLGPTKGAIDNMLDRAPGGRLEVAGGCFRVRQRNNWKCYLKNMHDGLHPMIVHQPSIDPARDGTKQQPAPIGDSAFALNVIAANGQTYKSMAALPVRIFPFGHTEMAAFCANLATDPQFSAYREELVAIHGA